MGNIVGLRIRLKALEQKRSASVHVPTKGERDAAFDAYHETLLRMTVAEFEAAEAKAIAGIPHDDLQSNRRAAIAAGFRAVERKRDDGNSPTPPRAA